MKKSNKIILLLIALSMLVISNQSQYHLIDDVYASSSAEDIDKIVEIDDKLKFKDMDKNEKEKLYKEYDKITSSSKDKRIATDYSQVKEIESENDYNQLIEKSKKEPVIIYLGFNECPFCKSFIPKLNHLANEYDVELNYYNTNKRIDDSNYLDVIKFFDIETVPHAFVIKDEKIITKLNEESTMNDMETFLVDFNKLDK
ncbi:bacteriocin transport accessory protein, putative [Ignavigranum ruoffiae]|uniref:Bacteriocin transport accessory protein, putative n=1 Tax=Ignavigranum ruoffiae TaxID=89093 RepID=A0A1H9GC25_9LACT|nr:thioredoxin domain-containing protein [Ignavigranum ruoffiae]SEQ47308.1 bacteriocin transport accessory protein, putative [Ignavigranum ruoffiae]